MLTKKMAADEAAKGKEESGCNMPRYSKYSTIAQNFQPLFNHLWRAGKYSYYWLNPFKTSHWFEVGQAPPPPADDSCIYFGVNPTYTIPPTNAQGEAKPPQWVRGQVDYIAAVNCLFGEYDIKDFGSQAAIFNHLETLPAPSVIVFSGGGYHCYWLLDKPFVINSDAGREYIRKVQAGWVTFVKSDEGAKDLARVLRVPGTRNHKPQYAPNYPRVEIIKADYGHLYRLADLEKMSRPTSVKKLTEVKPSSKNLPTQPAPNNHNPAYVTAALRSELGKLAKAKVGHRNPQLNRSAYALGQIVGAGALLESDVTAALESTALAIGLTDSEIAKTITSGIEAGKLKPRRIPGPRRQPRPTNGRDNDNVPGPKEAARLAEAEKIKADLEAKRKAQEARRIPVYKPDSIPFMILDQADYLQIVITRGTFTNAKDWQQYVEAHFPELDSEYEYQLKLTENREARQSFCGRPFQQVSATGKIVTKHICCGVCEHCKAVDRANLRRGFEALLIGRPLEKIPGREIICIRTDDQDRRQWSRRCRLKEIDYKVYPITLEGTVYFDVLIDAKMIDHYPELYELGQFIDLIDLTDYRLGLWLETPAGKRKSGKLIPSTRDLRKLAHDLEPFETTADNPDAVCLYLPGIITNAEEVPPPPPVDAAGNLEGLQAAINEAHEGQVKRLATRGFGVYGVTSRKFYTPKATLDKLIAEFNATQAALREAEKLKQPPN